MAGPCLVGGQRTVRDEMDVGLDDDAPGIIEDYASVHFRELGESGRCEGCVIEDEPARAGSGDCATVTKHDKATLALLDDPLESAPHWCARGKTLENLGDGRLAHVGQAIRT